MTESAFPIDNYTPHGYLDNPYDAGPWAELDAGGVIRSMEACGFGWFRPRGDDPQQAGLRVGLEGEETTLFTSEDFRAAGIDLISRRHTSRMQTFDFHHRGVQVSLAFVLAGRDALLCRATLRNLREPLKLIAQASVRRASRRNAVVEYVRDSDAMVLLVDPGPCYALRASLKSSDRRIRDDGRTVSKSTHVIGEVYSPEEGTVACELELVVAPGADGRAEAWIAFARGAIARETVALAEAALRDGAQTLATHLFEDQDFWKDAPRPVGDWPEAWRRGWVYDLETTRMMVRPSTGILRGPWPTWALFLPRIVLAENALDMMRLAYADPQLAQAALLTVFQDAPRANVPCFFANGSLNMVAQGGDACGTSPAWCLPFHNIYLLYLWHPDRAWLQAIFPHLEAYLRWWVDHRRDEDQWFVYRCTWEAGEDGSPRLDPARTGHSDIFHKVRPVELQAAVAQSALILVRLGRELHLTTNRLQEWTALWSEYTRRTRTMWDGASGRFRDAYPSGVSPVAGRGSYWGKPPDVSALQLIPLMYGVASPEQAAALVDRLLEFNAAPWTCWASWTYVTVEAARAAGAYDTAGRIAYDVLTGVYPRLDRRTDASIGARPGASAEWWADDLARTTPLNETYGWGATTATLFLRHLFGFGPDPDTSRVAFELAPALCDELLEPGRDLGFANLHYRGARFDLGLLVGSDGRLTARITPGSQETVWAEGDGGRIPGSAVDGSVQYQIKNCHRYRVSIG